MHIRKFSESFNGSSFRRGENELDRDAKNDQIQIQKKNRQRFKKKTKFLVKSNKKRKNVECGRLIVFSMSALRKISYLHCERRIWCLTQKRRKYPKEVSRVHSWLKKRQHTFGMLCLAKRTYERNQPKQIHWITHTTTSSYCNKGGRVVVTGAHTLKRHLLT